MLCSLFASLVFQLLTVVGHTRYRMEVSLEKIPSTPILLFIGVMKDSSSVVPLKLNARRMEHGAELQVFVKVELVLREP